VLALARFRARPGDATEPPQTPGNRTIELIWTLTPAVDDPTDPLPNRTIQ